MGNINAVRVTIGLPAYQRQEMMGIIRNSQLSIGQVFHDDREIVAIIDEATFLANRDAIASVHIAILCKDESRGSSCFLTATIDVKSCHITQYEREINHRDIVAIPVGLSRKMIKANGYEIAGRCVDFTHSQSVVHRLPVLIDID